MDNFDPNKEAEGLGDILAKITHRLGIAKMAQDIAHLVGKEDCGCNRRREILNEWVPFDKKDKKEDEDATERK
jgi:hypothetical protein